MSAYIIFFSNNYVIWAAKQFKKSGIEHKMVPVPRNLSSNCGMCVSLNQENISQAESLLNDLEIEYDRIEVLTK